MRLLLPALLLFGATQAAAQPYAYIPGYNDDQVSVLDAATNLVVATIPVGGNPWAVAATPDGSQVYVLNQAGNISVIDTATNTVVNSILVPAAGFGVAFAPDGATAYVATFSSDDIQVIDVETGSITGAITAGDSPYGIALTPDGSRLFVSNFGSDSVSVFDTATNTVIDTILAGNGPLQLAASPDGNHVYVANGESNNVLVIDTTTLTVVDSIAVPGRAVGIAVSPDGGSAQVATDSAALSWQLDLNTNTLLGAVAMPSRTWGVNYHPNGQTVYVTNSDAGSISAIDVASNTLITSTAVASAPFAHGMFFTPGVGVPVPGGVALDASPAAPRIYAEEIIATPGAPVTLLNPISVLNLSAPLGYNFSAGEVRYARFECDNGLRFNAGATATYYGAGNASLGAINGLGGSSLTFSITANNNTVVEGDRLVITGERSITGTDDVSCRYSLYDFPSQAQAGGADGRVFTVAGPYLRFAASYALAVDNEGNPVANVESVDPAFSQFDGAGPTFNADLGQIGGFSYGSRVDMSGAVQPRSAAGTPITLVDLMDADTALVFEGDFDAANDVYLSTNANCSINTQSADSFDATEAVFTIGSSDALDTFLCYEAGGTPIPVGTYTVTLDAQSASPAVYAVTDIGPLDLGEITRNGTELQAPLAQVPSGYLSRMVLTNTGALARGYVVEVLGETGNVISSANLTGSIPAGKTTVVDLTTVLTGFTATPRASLNVTIAGPNNQIQGLYQIVNPNSGTVSNHVMVRPGTN